jgi:peroxiredoxin Q/BCP
MKDLFILSIEYDACNMKIGDNAVDFSAESTHGRIRLSDYRGKNAVVLYFYVKDMTPGCTRQSIALKDTIDTIRSLGAEVIGVSSDDLSMHIKFVEKYSLTFPLVADTDNSISKAYGVYNAERNRARRVTFIIDREGVIRHIMDRVDVDTHAEDVINILKELNRKGSNTQR